MGAGSDLSPQYNMNFFQTQLFIHRKDFWRYKKLINKENSISKDNLFVSDLDFTPLKKIEGKNLFLKREDLSVLGSHKSRSLTYQIAWAKSHGVKLLTISTSGNAGITAGYFAKQAKLPLVIFTSKYTSSGKIAEMQKYDPLIIVSEIPYKLLEHLKTTYNAYDLRPSRDDNSINGLQSLGFELFEQMPDISKGTAIFMTTSSGSGILGMYKAFLHLKENSYIYSLPELHASQRGSLNSIVLHFDTHSLSFPEEKADSAWFKAKVQTKRVYDVIHAIEASNGFGWYIDKAQFQKAEEDLKKLNIEVSDESIMAYAGYLRALDERNDFKRAIVILSGKRFEDAHVDKKRLFYADTLEELDKILKSNALFS